MTTSNILYTEGDISSKVSLCATFIDDLAYKNDVILCPVLQSSYQFIAAVSSKLSTTPKLDFFGVQRYAEDNTEDELYMYKGADASLIANKTVVIVDVLCSSGTTLDLTSKISKQLGAKNVYTACLLYRQFSKHKPDWYGWMISDETVYGYGLDSNTGYRTIPYICYE